MDKEKIFECKSCSKENANKLNTSRFISKLDSFFKTNDLKSAGEYLSFWEAECRKIGDNRGLLTVLNEEIGFSRRTNDKNMAFSAICEAENLIENVGISESPSGAVIYINIATTLNCFGKPDEGISMYEKAEKVYSGTKLENTYEYAALLNNKATALCEMKKYDDAEKITNKAIEILVSEGKHDGEIAVSYINLAHLIFDSAKENDESVYEKVEKCLDNAWEYINSPNQAHDFNYAYILTKCAPSFGYFKREYERAALEETAKEIYGGAS